VAELGWERSFLGYPISDELATPMARALQLFQHGLYTGQRKRCQGSSKAIQDVLVGERTVRIRKCIHLWRRQTVDSQHSRINAVGFGLGKGTGRADGAIERISIGYLFRASRYQTQRRFFDCFKTYDRNPSGTGSTERWQSDCRDSNI